MDSQQTLTKCHANTQTSLTKKEKKTLHFQSKRTRTHKNRKKKKQKSNSTPKGSQQAGEAQEVDLGRYSGAAALPMNILQKLQRRTRVYSWGKTGGPGEAVKIKEEILVMLGSYQTPLRLSTGF